MRKKLEKFYKEYYVELQTAQLVVLVLLFGIICFGVWNGDRQRARIQELQIETIKEIPDIDSAIMKSQELRELLNK